MPESLQQRLQPQLSPFVRASDSARSLAEHGQPLPGHAVILLHSQMLGMLARDPQQP